MAVVTGPADRAQDDLDLVAGVRAGDDRAFELLFVRYQPRIAAYVQGMVRDRGRAEDITQEIFMSALRRMRATDREIAFKPWIYEIAKNACIDAYRRTRNVVEVSFDAQDAIGAGEHGRLAVPSATPDAAVQNKVAIDNLCGAFGGLSQAHHEILVLREFDGLSYQEIGERLGMSRPAVESTLFRARKRLSEEYGELVSGERCRRVQATVDAASTRGCGLRDRRRMARHLAHCQPCRRYARLAGLEPGDVSRSPVAAGRGARIAGLLPLPAFLQRRWGWNGDGGSLLGEPRNATVLQWTGQVATTVDPGIASGWAKGVATAATVAVAGLGAGATIERAGVKLPAASNAVVAAPAPAEPHAARAISTPLSASSDPGASAPAGGVATRVDPGPHGPAGTPDAARSPVPAPGLPAPVDPGRPAADASGPQAVDEPPSRSTESSRWSPGRGAAGPNRVSALDRALSAVRGGLRAPGASTRAPAERPRLGRRVLGAVVAPLKGLLGAGGAQAPGGSERTVDGEPAADAEPGGEEGSGGTEDAGEDGDESGSGLTDNVPATVAESISTTAAPTSLGG
ncbi:MAG: sigma-70 family RNA polymerase sigma factor [Solirubrobacteraceae bacterium]|nr:sigma-70 family RNA polymerase sigma factor [Solirubrobacteraceae bacterium]